MPKTSRKVVIITGVSKGIGKSITLEFMKHDWIVIGCARNKKIMNDMNKKYTHHSFTSVDVSDFNAVKSWNDVFITKHDVQYILINNAAINIMQYRSVDDYKRVMNINLFGSLNTIYCLLPEMKKTSKEIKILNVTSIAGILGFPEFSGYSMSKFAMEGMTQSFAGMLPNNIMMCCYDPGIVATDMYTESNYVTVKQALKDGCVSIDDWGKFNYPFIVNGLNRKDHNGIHVFGVKVRESIYQYAPQIKPFIAAFDAFQSKL